MVKEIISSRQVINTMVLFLFGSAVVLGIGSHAKEDAWLAILFAILISIPMGYIYSKLCTTYPGKDLYDITVIVFGRKIGSLINLLFIWYFFHLGALVIRNFSEFIQVVSLPETPQYIIAISMGVFCIWMVRAGLEVIVRWATFMCPIVVIMLLLITLLCIPKMDINNLKPILYNGLQPVLKNSFMIFSFPLTESIIFTTCLCSLRNQKDSYTVYFKCLIIGGIILIIATVRNLLVLGIEYSSSVYFPSYTVASVINISDFLQRIEVVVALNFMLAGIVKISICLFAACKGIAKLFSLHDYKKLSPPVGFLMINLSILVYRNIMEMVNWAFNIYPFYAIPFQVILPIILLLAALIKSRLKTDSSMKSQ